MLDRRSLLQGSVAFGASSIFGQQSATASINSLRIGVMPTLSARIIATQYEPMQAYLKKKLETSIAISTASDVSNFFRNVQTDSYDVVITAPHVARLIQTQLGFFPIANFQPHAKCVLVTLKNSESFLNSLQKNPKIAHSDPASLLTIVADQWFEKKGLRSSVDFELTRIRSAENIGFSIIRGDATAGVMSMCSFLAHPVTIRDQLSVSQLIAEIPAFYIMAAPRLHSATTHKLQTLYASFSEKSNEGKEFEARTTFSIASMLDEKELAKMDMYIEKTKKLLA
jgi:phosphonate transport system substrate-binding protein